MNYFTAHPSSTTSAETITDSTGRAQPTMTEAQARLNTVQAAYVVFGYGMGYMDGEELDVHGAGCQRSDPKEGSRDDYPTCDTNAPQGDEQRVFNMVRIVRDSD